MLDETRTLPFDISQTPLALEEEISTLIPRRGAGPRSPSLRRLVAATDSGSSGPTEEHPPQMEESPRPTDATEALLAEREGTHGSFENNARISQGFKETFRSYPGWHSLSMIEREALDMIALKISRVLSGRSMERQHWEDIAGYAKLVEIKCQ